MAPHSTAWLLLLVALLAIVQLTCHGPRLVALAQEEDHSFYERPGVSAAEILRARGFLADELYFTSTDGYVIQLTRGRNPLFNNNNNNNNNNNATGALAHKAPILFIHGILESTNVFVINSFGARPKDLSNVSLVGADGGQVAAQLAREPSAKSLPLLALNMGHEVWLMSRRGFPGSQQLVGDPASISASSRSHDQQQNLPPATPNLLDTPELGPFASALGAFFDYGTIAQQVPFSFDRKFWNFSLDEQARYDFPEAVDFVLEQAGRPKLVVVSHSAGGTIQLMALSLYPSLADKIESAVLWSEGFNLGHGDLFNLLGATLPFLEAYVGSVPPAFSTTQIQAVAGPFCIAPLAQVTLCEAVADLVLGPSFGQQPMRPEYINSLLYPTSSHEIAQIIQMARYGQVRHYNYGPFYNASAVQLKTMSFYVGANDFTVSPADVEATLPLLTVPYKFQLIKGAFNHNGYFYHRHNALLAIIPAMRDIQLQQRAARN